MAWYTDLLNKNQTTNVVNPNTDMSTLSNSTTVAPVSSNNFTSTTNTVNPNTDVSNLNSGSITDKLLNYNTNVDTSSLDNISGKLTSTIDELKNLKTSVGQEDVSNISSLRPENKYMSTVDESLSALKDYSTGDSKADRTAANLALSRLDASQGAASLAQAQRTASNPYLTQGAKAAAIAEQSREFGTQRATVTGELAKAAQERAFTATQKMADVAQVAANFEEGKFEYDVSEAGNAISRDIQTKIAAGELTSTQAQLEYQTAAKKIDTAVTANSEKIDIYKTLLSDENTKKQLNLSEQELSIKEAENKISQHSYWSTAAANSIMSAWESNTNLTASDIMNDPVSMQAITNAYQAIPGNEGQTPSESVVLGMMSTAKPEWKTTEETYNRNLENLTTTLKNSGASEESINYATSLMTITKDSGGSLSISQDGTISFINSDGSTMTTTDEYGNETPITLGNNTTTNENYNTTTSGEDIVSNITKSIGENTLNTLINQINSDEYGEDDVAKFNLALKNAAKEKGVSVGIDFEETKKLFYDIKEGKVKMTEAGISTEESDFEKLDVSGEDLLKNSNSEIIFDQWNEDPSVVRNSDNYYSVPDATEIKKLITSSINNSGEAKTTIDSDLKSTLTSSIGKMVEFPMSDGTVAGQLVSYETTPRSVQAKVKLTDGTTKNVVLYNATETPQGGKSFYKATIYGKEVDL